MYDSSMWRGTLGEHPSISYWVSQTYFGDLVDSFWSHRYGTMTVWYMDPITYSISKTIWATVILIADSNSTGSITPGTSVRPSSSQWKSPFTFGLYSRELDHQLWPFWRELGSISKTTWDTAILTSDSDSSWKTGLENICHMSQVSLFRYLGVPECDMTSLMRVLTLVCH